MAGAGDEDENQPMMVVLCDFDVKMVDWVISRGRCDSRNVS